MAAPKSTTTNPEGKSPPSSKTPPGTPWPEDWWLTAEDSAKLEAPLKRMGLIKDE